MSVVDGFLATWSNARRTFGEGTPQTGEQYDKSSAFTQLQSTVQTAAPGARWSGGAANAYDAVNTDHGRVLGQLAGLDQRLAAHVNQSAEVVAAGRQNLDSIRKWVVDAAASVPEGKSGDQIRLAIVQKGLTDLQRVIQQSNGDLNKIAGQMGGLRGEFEALGNGQKFKDGPQLVGPDGKPTDDEAKRRQAEKDVHGALAGDRDAAKRVEQVLGGIKPGQQLTAEQGSYLSQMQAQQHGMSVEALKTAEQRLGDQKHIIGDSWQLMSNPNVHFPKTETSVGALDNPGQMVTGSKTQLPESVQHALTRDGLHSIGAKLDPLSARTDNAHDVSTIAGIAHDGNQSLQQGTDLDRAMLDWSRDALHDPTKPGLYDSLGLGDYDKFAEARDNALGDVFNSAGRDHSSVTAELTDAKTGQQFLTDLHTHVWADTPTSIENRQSTHTLLDWIADDAHSSNDAVATRAGAAAHALAVNLDANHDRYLHPPGSPFGAEPNAANLNPQLISADAIALAPYQDALVGDLTGVKGFEKIGMTGEGDLHAARNVFAVIDSDPGAAKAFNAAAEQKILAHQQAFTDAATRGPTIADTANGDLRHAANLLGAVNGGAEQEATARGLQGAETDKAIYNIKKAGLDYLFENIPGHDLVPGIDMTRDTIEAGFLGTTSEGGTAQPNIPVYNAQHALNATYYQLATAFDARPGDPDIPPQFFSPEGRLLSPGDVAKANLDMDGYSTALENYAHNHGYGDLGNRFDRYFRQGAGK